MDILYIYKKPVFRCEENELRWSLRSLAQYGLNVGRVFVCGYCPDWLSDAVTKISYESAVNPADAQAKNWDIAHKVLYAVEHSDIGEEFLVSMDDHFLTRPVDFAHYPAYVKAAFGGHLPERKTGVTYADFLYDCRQFLLEKGLPTIYFTLHRNLPLTRTALRECAELLAEAERRHRAVELFTLVNNYRYAKGEIVPQVVEDIKISDLKGWGRAMSSPDGVFSTYDFLPSSGLSSRLAALYSTPCVYERQIAQKAAKRPKGLRVACVCMCKREENYIGEWLEYHFALGFDEVFLLDNNDFGDDAMQRKLADLGYDEGRLHYIDIRGIRYCQLEMYTKIYHEQRGNFDWIAFLDADEFLEFEDKGQTLTGLLSADPFKDADEVRFCWKLYGDSGLLDVVDGDYSVKRFTQPVPIESCGVRARICKSIINTRYAGEIHIHGIYDEKAVALNSAGEPCNNTDNTIGSEPFYGPAWLNHYRCKTIGEFVRQKVNRGDASEFGREHKYDDLTEFFHDNPYSREKSDYACKLYRELYGKR